MKKRWYILLYHQISWENGSLTWGTNDVCPPDIFRKHVSQINSLGRIVSFNEGFDLCSRRRKLDEPIFSFWFDDGWSGVSKYALPILNEYKSTGVISICSKYWRRNMLHLPCMLSYLNAIDGNRFLRSKLKKYGYTFGSSIKKFVLDQYNFDLVLEIEKIFKELTNPSFRSDAFRLFEDKIGLYRLLSEGWLLANHTTSHAPVAEKHCINFLQKEFIECDNAIYEDFGFIPSVWVIPYDRKGKRSELFFDYIRRLIVDKTIVFVGNKANQYENVKNNTLFRIPIPLISDIKPLFT